MFGDELPEPDKNVELLEKDVKLEDNQLLPVFENFAFKADKKLFNEGIMSFNDLKNAYFLIKTKELQKSKAIRDLVISKYIALSDYFSE